MGLVVVAAVGAIEFRSDLRNVVDLLERDSADHLLARCLCALVHSRLRNKAVSRTDGSRKDLQCGRQAAAGSQAVVTNPGDENLVRGENGRCH